MGRRAEQLPEEARIRDMTVDGRGIADLEGKTVFVDAALTGERVRFQRIRKRRNYDEARLLNVLESVPARHEPECAAFGVCGGCSLQHLQPDLQLELKQMTLLEAFTRIGKVQPERILSPLAGMHFGYRRRARLGAKQVDKKGRVLVGFREKHKPYIADMRHCETLVPALARLIPLLSDFIGSLHIGRAVPQIELSAADNAVALIFRVLEEPGPDDLRRFARFQRDTDVQVWLQSGGPATVRPLDGFTHPALAYELPDAGLRLEYGPLDFVQVNQDMNRRMIAQALELLAPQPGERILDMFCGIGNFTLPLATTGAHVVGVELDPVMVAKARANAIANNIDTTEFHAADLSRADGNQAWWRDEYATIVLDPPRAGAQEVLGLIAATSARRILYVSCHSGSLARDAGMLVHEHGFRLAAAGAMDMFPQTSHVEAMALFERTVQ